MNSRKINLIIIVVLGLYACKNDHSNNLEESESVEVLQPLDTIDLNLPIKKEVHLNTGISIQWLEEGTGEKVKDGSVYDIDYRVRLEDSTIIDGVHLLRKTSIPYLVGYNMQPAGWDITMRELRVGDFIHAQVPSRLLRGDKEAKGLIPKHSDNLLNIRVLREVPPTREIDGVKVWVMAETGKKTVKFSADNEIEFYTMISTKTNPFYFNSFASGKPFKARLEDNGLVPGLKKALINAKKGDRLLILIPSAQGYGAKGLHDIVKPNEDLFFNLYVNDVFE